MPQENEMITLSELESSLVTIDERVPTRPFSPASFKTHLEEFISPSIYKVNDLFDDLVMALEEKSEINNIIAQLEDEGKLLFHCMSLVISTDSTYISFDDYRCLDFLRTAPRLYLSPITDLYEYVNESNEAMLLPMLDRYLASFVMMWGCQTQINAINMCTVTMEEIAALPLTIKKAYAKGSKIALPAILPLLTVLSERVKEYFTHITRKPNENKYDDRCVLFWEYSQEEVYTGEYYNGNPYELRNFKEFTGFLSNIVVALNKLLNSNRILIISDLRCDISNTRNLQSGFSKICKKVLVEDCFQTAFSISDVKTNNLIRFLTKPE